LVANGVYKFKYKENQMLDKHKARLAIKDFALKEGIDYEETFGPTATMRTICFILSMET
jgi:hypothetical protein